MVLKQLSLLFYSMWVKAVEVVSVVKGKRVLFQARVADSFLTRVKGLMFSREVTPLLFVFEREARVKNSIHSFFCQPFDAVFLTSERVVSDVFVNVPCFKPFIAPSRDVKYLLELPAFTAKQEELKQGDVLRWKSV